MKIKLLIMVLSSFIANAVFSSTILLNQVPLPDVLPTTYYIADESKSSCSGRYNGNDFDGTEVTDVLTPDGEVIAQVCTRFFKILCMEGTGKLRDRGAGPLTVNWAGKYRFRVMDKCVHGEGVQGLCLLPYHTIAADLKAHSVGDIVMIPKAKGLALPDGRIHNGYFVVRDTGGAFRDIGHARIDLFVGDEDDHDNVFSRAGMHHRRPMKAYKLVGKMKKTAIEYFKKTFPELY